MTQSHTLREREKAFEDLFFQKRSKELIEAMRKREEHKAESAGLTETLGISEPSVLDPLLDAGLRQTNVTALVMAPLVAVAWADHSLDNEEQRALLKAEEHFGIDAESEAGQLLHAWLDHRPHESLFEAWAAYVAELCRVLEPDQRARLREEIVNRSRKIARGIEKTFLRAGGPTSSEKAVLNKIESAFDAVEKTEPDGSRGSVDKAICRLT